MNTSFPGKNGERYSVRAASAEDHERLAQWMEHDPYHKELKPEHWYQAEAGVQCLVLQDAQETPIFFWRIRRALRIEIQFNFATPHWNQVAMEDGMRWLAAKSQASGFRQIIFESISRPLINFCKRRLRFRSSPNELVFEIPAPSMPTKPTNALHQVQSTAAMPSGDN